MFEKKNFLLKTKIHITDVFDITCEVIALDPLTCIKALKNYHKKHINIFLTCSNK